MVWLDYLHVSSTACFACCAWPNDQTSSQRKNNLWTCDMFLTNKWHGVHIWTRTQRRVGLYANKRWSRQSLSRFLSLKNQGSDTNGQSLLFVAVTEGLVKDIQNTIKGPLPSFLLSTALLQDAEVGHHVDAVEDIRSILRLFEWETFASWLSQNIPFSGENTTFWWRH